jgi:hypothetical protein
MKPKLVTVLALLFLSSISLNLYSQIEKKDKDALMAILKCSIYKPTIVIDNNGLLSRKDNNGNSFTYNIRDIAEFKYFYDGNNCVWIILKSGMKVESIVEGRKVEADSNVFAFDSKDDCDKTIEVFNKILKKLNK